MEDCIVVCTLQQEALLPRFTVLVGSAAIILPPSCRARGAAIVYSSLFVFFESDAKEDPRDIV
jgi:hypothetical protein